jgi:hypothetical protein
MKDINEIPIKPTDYINFPKYEGPLIKPYLVRKQSKMKKAISTLVNDTNKSQEKKITKKQYMYLELYKKMKSYAKVAEIFGVSQQAVNNSIGKLVSNDPTINSKT